MAQETLTFRLEGEVNLAAFAEAMAGFRDLIAALQKETISTSGIDWKLDQLEIGSAIATVRGEGATKRDRKGIESVVQGYESVGRACSTKTRFGHSKEVEAGARRLLGVIGGEITSVILETDSRDFQVTERPNKRGPLYPGMNRPATDAAETGSPGSVTGRIQSVSNRGGLRFTAYDCNTDQAISCYLQPGKEDELREAWGRLACVQGLIRRSPSTGQPISAREITRIEIIKERPAGAWREAIGAAPFRKGDELPEVAIRRMRDAWR